MPVVEYLPRRRLDSESWRVPPTVRCVPRLGVWSTDAATELAGEVRANTERLTEGSTAASLVPSGATSGRVQR